MNIYYSGALKASYLDQSSIMLSQTLLFADPIPQIQPQQKYEEQQNHLIPQVQLNYYIFDKQIFSFKIFLLRKFL